SFLENHLSTLQQSSRFLEVTTFSSLLTTSDIKTVACVLGLQSNRLLLLSLHQFDTEASFCSKIRSFLQDAEPSPHIVIVQMDLEEHCSVELIASAKYCTMNYLMSLGHPACCVVFIAKLSRIPSGPRYIGIWQSVHIDDLRDTEDMSLNLLAFSDTPVSKLLHPGTSEKERMEVERTTENTDEDKETCPKDQAAYLHGLSLVRSCVQKAVGLLRDPSGGAAPARSVERIHTLLTLLRNGQDDTNARFQEVLLGRLAQALALREGTEVSPGEWLNAEARKRQALREGGTLRHTVWRCLQSRVTPVLASVVEVLDRGANLDLLLGGRLSPGLTGLWLDVFSDAQILDLTAPQTPSWLIRGCLQSLWDESEFIPVASDDSAWRIQQFVSAFDNSPLGAYLQKLSEQEQVEYGHRFLHDFLLLSLKISTKAELRMFTKALSGCVSELQCNTAASCHLSPAWVMAAAKHYAPRLHTLSHTMLLQDQLPSEIYQLGTHRETSEMIEDILALGICVEKTKLLSVTSLEECKVFVRRVELLQPCLERALSHNYSALCGPGCLQHLNSMRWAWCGMLVIAAFIQRVLLEATQGDAGLKELALKHCSVLQRLMLEMPDLRNVVTLQQLIRILNSYDEESTGRTLRYGSQCAVCLSELKDPCLLPCEHVICMPCVQKCVSPDRRFCPKCRTDLPPDHQLTVSPDVTTALEKQAEVRASCNSFFLEVVSRFCLSEDQSPSAEVVELLFSLLISAHGDVYRTRELSPFLECVDNSPVVRSVLPKLLLQYSFDKVKVHIQSYLKNLEDNIMQGGDRTGLYLLFVNCFQDSLLCSEVEEAEAPGGRWRRLREECRFLSRLARRQTPDRQEDPAEFLLNMARLRRCLATAANALHTLLQASESTEESHESEQYLQQVRAVLDYCGHDWYRVYLLRALNRQANRDFILALMKDPRWRWVFPPEVLRLQSMVTLEVDPFLCVGPRYKALRDAVGQVLLEDRTDALQGELQKQTGPQAHAFLALALFREVARRCVSPDPKLRPSPQATATLEDLLKDRDMPETLRAFCTALLSNRIGGPGSSLSLGQGLPPGRRTLLELLVHQDSVLLAGDSLLAPLHRIAFQTASATRSFLPTMPDDHASEARQWLKEKKLQSFEVFPMTLSLYVNSPEQPLPSTDEVLVCREATTEEEVEIFFRRALGQGSKVNQKRIYSLVNPGLLGYEVSVALGELFDGMERSAGVGYRLVIVSPLVHQHRYVPSFFSNHKVQAGVTVTAETSRRYIHHHFTITDIDSPVSMISPKKLSVWVVSSQRPAVDRLASVREQDPILLHIDTAAVSSGLEEFLFQSFRLVVVEDQKKVYEHFPVPLINRLEKHRVGRSTDLTPWQRRVLEKLEEWSFLENHLSTLQQSSRFLEVTTFSSLLTTSDVKTVACVLGLQSNRLLLLSLHQFDTEASFCSKIRSFLQDAEPSPHIVIVQMDLEEHCSVELIASAKYCTMNYLMSLGHPACCVVFIAKLSRIPSGPRYIGFQGGIWQSVHIDDLRDTEDMSLNLLAFSDTPLKDQAAYLHGLSLVRSCVQKAVGLLRDPSGGAGARSVERIHTLLTLLRNGQDDTNARFQEVLLGRLAQALALREGTEVSPGEWLNAEARKRQALREGGTLRHTVWRCLQSRVTPVLASVVEVLDRGANLDLLLGGRLSPGLTGLWLDVFSDAQILDLTAPQTPSRSEQEILVQGSVVLEGEEQPCVAPFSWLIRGCLQSLWDESEFIPVASDDSVWRIQQFVSAFDNSPLGAYLQKLSEQEQVEYGHRFLHDFLLLSLKISTKAELRMFTKALSGCVSELQCNTAASCHLSPAWVMAAAKHYAPRLHTLSHTMLLQDQLPSEIYQLGTRREPSEMIEDILALGICVEKTKLLSVTSLEECKVFVRRVELLQPCLERALSHNYSALCGPGCLQHLNSMRWAWCGMLVIAAFIQRVLLEATQGDAGLKELALKHCSVLQRLMLEMPDLRNVVTLQQLIRILNSYDEESTGRTLRYGSQCAVCLSELKDPCLLPCEHVICMPCVLEWVSPDRRFCPKCRTDLPPDHQLTVSPDVTTALEKQAEVRASCNSFFLEVVSRFCLSEDQSPSAEVVELLFSLLISAHGDVYRTRELSPFLECVDNSPVVRSVLPKLLLQYSFDKVKVHIQSYLKNLEDNIMQGGDRTGLYLLFVNCFQDSLLCSEVEEAEAPGGRRRRLREECRFLSRLARRQTPDRQADPAEFLLNMARLRRCLAIAANTLHTLLQASESTEESHESEQYLQQVRAVLDYCGHDWYRVYLLRALNRQANRDFILALMKDPRWRWVFPPEVLRLQSMVTLEVDPFLCVGPRYRALRDAVGQALLEDRTDALQGELQKQTGPQAHAFLALALFREVARRCVSPDPKLRPSPQATATLEDLLKDRDMPETLRAFCTALLSNRIGGPGSSLSLGQGLPPGRRTLLELLVHQDSVLLAGDSLLAPLHRIAFQTASATRSFLPTMPDDHTSEARQWLTREKKLQSFVCANGHLCFVGECGRPVDISKCPDCGVPIGGQNHSPVPGFKPSTQSLEDQTRTGHILGEAHRRSEAPERQMTPAQTGVLRLLTHLAMLQGAVGNLQAVGDMVHPTPRDVVSFLWSHLEQDVLALGRTLDLNADDTAAAVHLVLATCTELTPGLRGAEPDLTSRQGRAGWERRVCGSVIDPVLQNLKGKLAEARKTITSDDSLAGSPLMRLLYGDPGPLLSLSTDPDCPTKCLAFWGLPEAVTVERFSQLLGQHPGRSSLPLLVLFLQKISYIRQIQHLPELAALQSDLLKIFPLVSSDATSQSIGEMLHRLPAGRQRKVVSERVGRLVHVWNCLRLEMTRDPADLGLEVELCEKELTMDSSGGFLVPCRRGPGSCLRALVDCLSKAHNSLVMGARKLSDQESSDYSVPLEGISDTQLALCHPERQLLPLVLSHCHYTLKKGQETDSSYDMTGIQTQLARRFLAGKPVIRADTERFLNRHLQDFSVVLSDVRMKIPQNPLKGSVCTGVRSALRCYADACDAVFVVEIGLRFLGKTGGGPRDSLMTYLTQSLKIGAQISSSVAEALGESRLEHSVFIWQLLTCWKSELMLNRKQDPFQGLGSEYREGLTAEDRRGLNEFLAVVDTGSFSRELHEVLLLKTGGSQPDRDYHPHWEIRSTLETHLDQKNVPPLQGLEALPEDITLAKGADVWTAAVEFRRG
ncbi:hypothetical protein NHX12_024905, partial [Muraenolepis orangiensis]